MFELVPKVRQRQCIVVETDRKSIPSRHPPYVDSLTRGTSCWPRRADLRCRCPSVLETGRENVSWFPETMATFLVWGPVTVCDYRHSLLECIH